MPVRRRSAGWFRAVPWLVICIVFISTAGTYAAEKDCEYQRVIRVIDGDTFIVETEERVRLIGVDTPEIVDVREDVQWFGREASKKLKSMIGGKDVCLKRDKDKTIDRDKYNRLLRYVWINDVFVNRELIREGYAFAYTAYPFQYLDDFRAQERAARKSHAGLWNVEKQKTWQREKKRNLALLKTCGIDGTICPWDAKGFTGKRRTVRFFVKKAHDAGDRVFLNSENNYRDERNFTAMIIKTPRMHGLDIEDMFWGKTVDVTGRVELYEGRMEIVVKDLSQLRVVQPHEN